MKTIGSSKRHGRFRLKLGSKLLIVVISLFILFGMATLFVSDKLLQEASMESITSKLVADSNLGYQFIDSKYPGSWNIRDGKLYKGDRLIDGNYGIVDEIKKSTGSLATLFVKDKNKNEYIRVSTNVIKQDGKRAVGTPMAKNIQEKMDKGELYIGEAKVVDKICESRYMPLKDDGGNIVGVWFVGVEKSIIKENALKLIKVMAYINAGMIGICLLIIYMIIRSIVKNVKNVLVRLNM